MNSQSNSMGLRPSQCVNITVINTIFGFFLVASIFFGGVITAVAAPPSKCGGLFGGVTTAVASPPSKSGALLSSILFDEFGLDIMLTHSLSTLVERSSELNTYLQQEQGKNCTYNCTVQSGKVTAVFEAKKHGHHSYHDLVSARNSQKFIDSDPIFGEVEVDLFQKSKDDSVPFDRVSDGPLYDFQFAEWEVKRALLYLLKPENLELVHDQISTKFRGPESGTFEVPKVDDFYKDPEPQMSLQTALAYMGFRTGPVTYKVNSTNRSISLDNGENLIIELQFDSKSAAGVIKGMRVTQQVRYSFVSVDISFKNGKLDLARSNYQQQQEKNRVARENAEEAKAIKAHQAVEMSEGQYSTKPHPANPDGNIGGNMFNEWRMFKVSPEKTVVNGSVTFLMADSPRPNAIQVGSVIYNLNYMRDGIVQAMTAESVPINGSYVKRKINDATTGKLSSAMVEVTLYLPTSELPTLPN